MGGGEKLFSEYIMFPAICFFSFISLGLTSHFGNYAPSFLSLIFVLLFFFPQHQEEEMPHFET